MLLRLLLPALAMPLLLASCGGDETSTDTTSDSAAEFNDADVEFATGMIQHHAQALVMVDLAMGKELDPRVTALTEQIRAAQAPEIELMADWLTDWDQPVPETMRDHANAHGGHMEDSDMPGMMSAEELDDLAAASGPAFQEMWLEMMVEHHEGAVEMAEDEVSEGEYADAVELAEDIIESQTAEIEQMEQMLGTR